MKAKIYDKEGNAIREIELPVHFEEEVRPDLIKRAVLAIYSHKRQPYGKYPEAGKETSAWTSKRRRSYRTSYGYGISRVPRAVVWGKPHFGGVFIWVARRVPNAVKGYKAHGPTSEKIWYEKINKKERRKAIRSAISATANEFFVINRYSKLKENIKEVISKFGLPLIIDSDFENIKKIKELKEVIKNFLDKEILEKFSEKKIRAGKGKMRGRKYKKHRGLLIVVSSENSNLYKYCNSIEFGEIVPVHLLNAEVLAPGCKPGRLTIWSSQAIERLKKERLFL